MSSMRNAVTRRPHKERSQPQSREKWGLLEKHKDYSLRARDYNLKKAKLAILSSKARDRNPDEFAFGMMSADKGRQGAHGSRKADETRLSHDAVKLLKTQDAGYLRTVAGKGRRDLERLEEAVGLQQGINGSGMGKKIVFVEGVEVGKPLRRKRKSAELVAHENADANGEIQHDEAHARTAEKAEVAPKSELAPQEEQEQDAAALKPKSKKALLSEQRTKLDMRAERKRRKRLGEMRAAKLEALKKRQREILAAADQLELQRAKMSRSVGGVNKDGVKWKVRERKR